MEAIANDEKDTISSSSVLTLTDLTVVFMNSFLCERSKSGYLAYTRLHTVFIVISSKFALSSISFTYFLMSSS